jgi:hypothetical protein
MPSHSFTPRPMTEVELAATQILYPEFFAWVEGLSDEERATLSFSLEVEPDGMLSITFATTDSAPRAQNPREPSR